MLRACPLAVPPFPEPSAPNPTDSSSVRWRTVEPVQSPVRCHPRCCLSWSPASSRSPQCKASFPLQPNIVCEVLHVPHQSSAPLHDARYTVPCFTVKLLQAQELRAENEVPALPSGGTRHRKWGKVHVYSQVPAVPLELALMAAAQESKLQLAKPKGGGCLHLQT